MGNKIDSLHKKAKEIVEKKDELSEKSNLLSGDLTEIRALIDEPLLDEDDVTSESYLEEAVTSDLSTITSEFQDNDSERKDTLDETDEYIASLEENLKNLEEMRSVSDLRMDSMSSYSTERRIEELQSIRELLEGDDDSSKYMAAETVKSSKSTETSLNTFKEFYKVDPEKMSEDNADPVLTEIGRSNNVQLANIVKMYHLAKDADFGNLDNRVAQEMVRTVYKTKKEFKNLEMQFIGSLQERNKRFRRKLAKIYLDAYKKANPDMSEEELLPYVRENVDWDMRKAKVTQSDAIAQSWTVKANRIDVFLDKAASLFNGIVINEGYGADYEHFLSIKRNEVASGHKPLGCDTVKATIDHELGHQIDSLLDARIDSIIKSTYNDFMLMVPQRQIDELSSYAATNIGEFIAECWSEYRNNPECRGIAKKIGKRIEFIRCSNSHGSIGQKEHDPASINER